MIYILEKKFLLRVESKHKGGVLFCVYLFIFSYIAKGASFKETLKRIIPNFIEV